MGSSESIEIIPADSGQVADAARLVATRYRALRARVPEMPLRYDDSASFLSQLNSLMEQGPGVVALKGGRLVGFLGAWLLAGFRGKRAVYSPEWGNAADLADSARIYRAMYERISNQWVADRRELHVLSLMAHDSAAVEAWHRQGFGMMAVDAVRDLSPVNEGHESIALQRAGPDDAEQVWALDRALHRTLAGPPVFLYDEEEEGPERWERWLGDTGNALWLAREGGKAVAYMMFGPANQDASMIIDDAGTTSITGAYTRAERRGRGIGTALLNEGLSWAQSANYVRCAVDFEPENVQGGRFWMSHFVPVCYSLARHVDRRIIGLA